MSSILKHQFTEFRSGRDLGPDDAEEFLDALIYDTDEALLANVFRAWNEKGIAEDEIYSVAKILRSRMKAIHSRHELFVDIVGTGGSKAKTFNVSTAASFVVAGTGIAVAKHGNKAATSNTGSTDVLSELGIDPTVGPDVAEMCLNEIGIAFMFAPNFHRLSQTLAKVRRGLGFPTIFNCVGPLCNPASAPHQLIGVWNKELVTKMANALARLGTKRSWIVHGDDGLDEISINGRTMVVEVEGRTVREFTIEPEHFGIAPAGLRDLRSNDAVHSGKTIRNVLIGKPDSSAAKDIVLVNAAAAIHIATGNSDLKASMTVAAEAVNVGKAFRKLEELASAIPV